MIQKSKQKYLATAMLATVVAFFAIGSTTMADETIAYWKFDSGNLTLDSSGNGYSLMTQGNVIADADDFDGLGTASQGSISFDGISACAATLNTINLSPYEAVRLSFYMKNESTSIASALEHTGSYWGNGGFAVFPSRFSQNDGGASISTGPNQFGAADPLVTQAGVWEQFTVEYWPQAPNVSDVVKVYKNGSLLDESTYAGLTADPVSNIAWDTETRSAADLFTNDYFYFGARNLARQTGSELYFDGNLDEVKLEGFDPTPSTTRTEISFPDISGYQTLVCDFHTHTYYSDGWVMPETRVEEAYRTGLDAVAITDHIEYKRDCGRILPNSDDENTGSDLAIAAAAQYDEVIAIKGTEVTRNVTNVAGDPYLSPYDGHYLGLFLNDVNALDIDEDPAYANATEETKIFAAAVETENQGGFFAWAHHNLSTEENWESTTDNWSSLQDNLMANNLLDGLEVANHGDYYPLAHQWCIDKGLTMLGNSDMHDPDNRNANTSEDHRTSTLVFAEEYTTAGIQEALEAGRTAVWLNENIIGLEVYLAPLFDESVTIEQVSITNDEVQFEITNSGPVDLQLTRTGTIGPSTLELEAGGTTTLTFSITGSQEEILLDYIVDNFLIAPSEGMPVSLTLEIDAPVPGDANGDGKVDGSDVTILANHWQHGVNGTADATWAMGDFNYDGKVDGSDVTILANNWQKNVSSGTAAVPEPSTLALMLCGMVCLFWGGMKNLKKASKTFCYLTRLMLLLVCVNVVQLAFAAEVIKIEMPIRGVCAHRGASDTHPENTLEAFKEAVRVGAHQIECDVQFTKDGHLVIMHDDTVDRTTNGKGRVSDLTLAEIKKLDAGIKKHARFAGCRVPTLVETLKIMPRNIWLNLHLKEFRGSRKLGMKVAREVVRQNRTHQAFLACGHNAAEGAREVCPDILICNMERQGGNVPSYVNDTIDRKCQFIQLLWKAASPEEMKRLKEAGVKINLFAGPTVKALKEAYDSGVQFPLVNDIAPVMKEAEKHGVKPLEAIY